MFVTYIGNMQRRAIAAGPAFGEHIRGLRERQAEVANGYSLRKVAARCGVTPAYLSRVERGEVAPPGEETLIKIARELGEIGEIGLNCTQLADLALYWRENSHYKRQGKVDSLPYPNQTCCPRRTKKFP